MRVLIATKNQGKIEGAKRALEKYFANIEIQGVPVESNVSEQPVNNEICYGFKKYINENNWR